VFDEGLAGADDSTILERVQSDGRTLLTMDKGIADIRVYPPDQYAGIILFRPRSTGRSAMLALCGGISRLCFSRMSTATCLLSRNPAYASASGPISARPTR